MASSNRVTEFYEEDGRSSLGREITAEGLPADEKHVWCTEAVRREPRPGISPLTPRLTVICLRLGT